MGACIGKKSSKYLKADRQKSDVIQAPQPNIQDHHPTNEPSPSLSKKLQMIGESTDNNNDEYRLSKFDQTSLDSELQLIIAEQTTINQILNQPFSTRVISVAESELEYELANLVYGCPLIDYKENPLVSTTVKSVDL